MLIDCTRCGSQYEIKTEISAALRSCPICMPSNTLQSNTMAMPGLIQKAFPGKKEVKKDKKIEVAKDKSILRIPSILKKEKRGRPKKLGTTQRRKVGTTRPRTKYNKEVIDYIRQCAKTMNIDEITDAVNNKFGFSTNAASMDSLMDRRKIKRWMKKKPGPKGLKKDRRGIVKGTKRGPYKKRISMDTPKKKISIDISKGPKEQFHCTNCGEELNSYNVCFLKRKSYCSKCFNGEKDRNRRKPKEGLRKLPNGPSLIHDGKSIGCPECGSTKIVKAGTRKTKYRGRVQKYKCTDCKRKFLLEPEFRIVKVTKEIREFIWQNATVISRKLVEKIKEKFDIDISHTKICNIRKQRPAGFGKEPKRSRGRPSNVNTPEEVQSFLEDNKEESRLDENYMDQVPEEMTGEVEE